MFFLNIEGADAVGKHTAAERMRQRYEELKTNPRVFSFPRYNTVVGQAILRHLKGETTLVSATGERHQDDALAFQALMVLDKYAASSEIREHLTSNGVVITDRWWQSAWAYGGSDGISDEFLERCHQDLPQAHLNILLDLDPAAALARRPNTRDRYEADRDKMAVVRERYRTLWAKMQDQPGERVGRYLVLDASEPAEDVYARIASACAQQVIAMIRWGNPQVW